MKMMRFISQGAPTVDPKKNENRRSRKGLVMQIPLSFEEIPNP
jgi:hypothetical protein